MSKKSLIRSLRKLKLELLVLGVILTAVFNLVLVRRFTQSTTPQHTTQAAGVTYYASSSGSGSSCSSGSPCSLTTALGSSSPANSGDTVYLKGGQYRGGCFVSSKSGTSGSPIVYSSAPGERATIVATGTCSGGVLLIQGSYVTFKDIEITSSITNSVSDHTTSPAGIWLGNASSIQRNVNFINMVVHNMPGHGIGWWQNANDSEIYGSLFYNNGTTKYDHNIYSQNATGYKKLTNSILHTAAGHGLHAYSSNRLINNYTLEGNASFNNGILDEDSATRNYLWGTESIKIHNMNFKNNYGYHNSGGIALNFGYHAGCDGATLTSNYLAGGPMEFYNCSINSMTGNTFYVSSVTPSSIKSSYPNNNWLTLKPTTNSIFVRPNAYDNKRANVIIFNWNRTSTITLSSTQLASLNLKTGDAYELRNSQNYYGDIIRGTYNGSYLSVPMTGRTVEKPINTSFSTPSSTFPEFGVFVVFNLGGGTGNSPTPTSKVTPTPTTSATITQSTYTTVADAYVNSSSPNSNYGSTSTLEVDGDPGYKKAYLKFNLSDLSGKTITKAYLRLRTTSSASSASSSTIDVRSLADTNQDWQEGSITFNARPKLASTSITSFIPKSINTIYSIDVTSFISSRGGQNVTLGLDTFGSDGTDFYSKEGAYKPQLIVSYQSSSSTPTPTPKATPTIGSFTPTPTPPSSVGKTVTLQPVADTYVNSAYPNSNYGTRTIVLSNGSPIRKTFLRFDLGILPGGSFTKAELRLRTTGSTSRATFSTRALSDPNASWSETTLKYSNYPGISSTAVSTFIPNTSNTWYTANVTSIVAPRVGNTVTIVVDSTTSDGADFYSRESSYDPELIVTY